MNNKKLKFRVWSISGQFFTKTNTFATTNEGAIYPFGISPEAVIVQQFTGLFDKNGTEIYEGDIVHVDSDDDLNGNYEIEYVPGFFYLKPLCGVDWKLAASAYNNKVKIIGNIFENPELLNKQS